LARPEPEKSEVWGTEQDRGLDRWHHSRYQGATTGPKMQSLGSQESFVGVVMSPTCVVNSKDPHLFALLLP
jgi:hypothetical protein